jgi:hypothetical protein
MTLSLGWSLFNLPENGRGRLAFSFEKPKLVPQSDDFAVFYGIHSIHLALKANANEKRTNLKPIEFVVESKSGTTK